MDTTTEKINDVMDHPRIPNSGKVLYHLLTRRADEHGFVHETLPELGRQMNLDPTYIPAIAAPLEQLGFIRRESAKGHGRGRKRYVVLALAAAIFTGSPYPANSRPLDIVGVQSNLHFAGKKAFGEDADLTEEAAA